MTSKATVRISRQTRDRLKGLAGEDRLTMDAELAQVLDQAEEARFWAGVREDYARLQDDPGQWDDYVSELAGWDSTTGDELAHE
jgi:hypothetical protein